MRRWQKAGLIAAIVLVTDLATKALIDTPFWGIHHRTLRWEEMSLIPITACIVLMLLPRIWWAAGIIMGGLLGNVLDVVASGGGGHNPFVVGWGDTQMGYNVADLSLVSGVLLGVLVGLYSIPAMARWRHPPPIARDPMLDSYRAGRLDR
jgi:hypothetical protein